MTWHLSHVRPPVGLNDRTMEYVRIAVKPLAGALGAELSGVDLSEPLDQETVSEIHQALLDHLVILFHDQDLTPDEYKRFGANFGTFHIHPFVKGLDGYPEIMVVAKEPEDELNFSGVWHSDVTFQERPPLGSMMHAKVMPEHGGDTLFANQYLAYDTLSDTMKEVLDGMIALHSARLIYGEDEGNYDAEYQDGHGGTKLKLDKAAEEVFQHPVVRTHPETGRKALYVNRPFTVGLKDMKLEESEPILKFLCAHSARPDFSARVRWREGSVGMWDNRAAQHYALNDYPGKRRVMHRLTLNGDRPF